MAPKGSKPNGVVLYRCSLGGEMKPIVAFSKHQQKKVGYGIKNIDPNHSKMVCTEHAPGPAMEENCDHCNRRLPLDQFSKRTRRLNEFVCIACREWLESEPDPAILAAKARAAAREDKKYMWKEAVVDKTEFEKQTIAKTQPKKSAFSKAKTSDLSDTESVIDSMYGFLDHLLEDAEDEEDDAASIGNKTVTTTTETSRNAPVMRNARPPLVVLSSAGSGITEIRPKKQPAADAEMSTVASNSWYGGGKIDKVITHTPKGPSDAKSNEDSSQKTERTAPHLMSARSTDNSQNSLPPHLRSSIENTGTKRLAPHERSSFIALASDELSDGGSEKTIPANNDDDTRTIIQEEPCVHTNPDAFIVPDIRRAMRILHKEHEEWMKNQPEFEMDDDSEVDQN